MVDVLVVIQNLGVVRVHGVVAFQVCSASTKYSHLMQLHVDVHWVIGKGTCLFVPQR